MAGAGASEGAAPSPQNAQQAGLLALLQTMMALALSPGAEAAYDSGVTHWFTFVTCVWGDRAALLLPTDWVLACFVAWLSMHYTMKNGKPLKYGSIRTYLFGVQSFYASCGLPGILRKANAGRTWAAMKCVEKFSEAVKRVMPITFRMVAMICGIPIQGWDDEVFQVAVLLGFFFLLRVGEFCETGAYPGAEGDVGVRHLRLKDLVFSDANRRPLIINSEKDAVRARFLHVNVHASKTDQTWAGCLRLCEALPVDQSAVCVVFRAARFVALARERKQRPDGPLLRLASGVPADDSWFRAALKAVLGMLVIDGVRVDPTPFNTHSLRAGGATRLFELGRTPQFIAMMGRWTSDAVLNYIRTTDFDLFSGVACAMAQP